MIQMLRLSIFAVISTDFSAQSLRRGIKYTPTCFALKGHET